MQDRHPIPTGSPADTPLSTHVRRPRLYLRIEELFPPLSFPARRRLLAAGVLAAAVTVGLLLWPWEASRADPPAGDGGSLGGIPSQTPGEGEETSLDGESDSAESEAECAPADTDSTAAEPSESDPAPDTDGTADTPTDPPPATEPISTQATTEEVSPPVGDGTVSEIPTVQETPTDTSPATDNEAPTDPPPETATEAPTEAVTEAPPVPVPEGCLPFVTVDRSESHMGVGYIDSGGSRLPHALPTDAPFTVKSPAVLIVNTHPYEGYGGGAAWYDPALGGLAVTDSPNAPDGVVALGSALARALRDQGVTVIHLRIPVSAGDTASVIRGRTEEAVRYYRRLYPDIGLVLDLRRSAELTAEGGILATKGDLNGSPCAQLRLSVSGGRDETALGYDLAVALSVREKLWDTSPTLSRPVGVKSGGGIAGDVADLRILTLEMGSAGNTYAEARATVEPLARAISAVIQKYS